VVLRPTRHKTGHSGDFSPSQRNKNTHSPVKGNCTTTHTHLFNGPLSRTTQVSQYKKDKTNLDFTEARESEWQWHQLGHMQVCTSLQTDNHASKPTQSVFYKPDALPAAQPTASKHWRPVLLQRKINRKTKARFSLLLRHPAWKWSGSILKGKDKYIREEISEESEEIRISVEAYNINKETIYTAPKSKIESSAHYTPEPAWGDYSS